MFDSSWRDEIIFSSFWKLLKPSRITYVKMCSKNAPFDIFRIFYHQVTWFINKAYEFVENAHKITYATRTVM